MQKYAGNYQNGLSLQCLLRSVCKPTSNGKWNAELIITVNNDTSMSLKDRLFFFFALIFRWTSFLVSGPKKTDF